MEITLYELKDEAVLLVAGDLDVKEFHNVRVGEIPEADNLADDISRNALAMILLDLELLDGNNLIVLAVT